MESILYFRMNQSSSAEALSEKCLSQKKLIQALISLLPLDLVIQKNIFPILFIFGIVGNTLNLFVLLGRKMRTKTNILLACMALADIAVLLSMSFRSLSSFEFLVLNPSYYSFYRRNQNFLVATANWFSAASIW